MNEAHIENLGHRICWRYKHSSDPAHSHTYLFNRSTLLQFAQAVIEGTDEHEAQEVHKALDSRGVPRKSLKGLEYSLWGRIRCLIESERFAERERVAQEFDRRSVLHDGSPSPGWYEPEEPAAIVRGMA